MAIDWISKIRDIDKIPSKIILWICIASGAFFIIPKDLITRLRLDDFIRDYNGFVGIIFIASALLLFINVIMWFVNFVQDKQHKSEIEKSIVSSISKLDESEKAVLREFHIQGKHTIQLPIDNSGVAGLLNKKIIERVGSVGSTSAIGMLFPIMISNFASRHITKTSIGIPIECTEQQKQQLINTRPAFVKFIEHFNL